MVFLIDCFIMDYVKVTLLYLSFMLLFVACSVFVQSQKNVCGSSQDVEQSVDSTDVELKVNEK